MQQSFAAVQCAVCGARTQLTTGYLRCDEFSSFFVGLFRFSCLLFVAAVVGTAEIGFCFHIVSSSSPLLSIRLALGRTSAPNRNLMSNTRNLIYALHFSIPADCLTLLTLAPPEAVTLLHRKIGKVICGERMAMAVTLRNAIINM